MCKRLIEVSGASNVRGFIGYTNIKGQTIKNNSFIRSGNISNIDDLGKKQLERLNIDLVIDLRSEREVELSHPEINNFEYINIPMMDNVHSKVVGNISDSFPKSLESMYINLLENSITQIKMIFKLLADEKYKTILYNCFAGKDRTGIITMLLLGSLEISEEIIITDYSLSEEYFTFNKNDYTGFNIPEFLLESKKEYMENILEYIEKKYGGILNYLNKIGISNDEIDRIRKKVFI